MMPRLSNRSVRSRAVRGTMGEPRLENLAAEFALLTQRRSRAIHQMAILDQQRAAAAAGFAKLQKRIAWLMQRMDALTPDLRDPAATGPGAAAPAASGMPIAQPTALSAQAASALAVIGREWAAAQPALHQGVPHQATHAQAAPHQATHAQATPHQPTHHDRPVRTRRA